MAVYLCSSVPPCLLYVFLVSTSSVSSKCSTFFLGRILSGLTCIWHYSIIYSTVLYLKLIHHSGDTKENAPEGVIPANALAVLWFLYDENINCCIWGSHWIYIHVYNFVASMIMHVLVLARLNLCLRWPEMIHFSCGTRNQDRWLTVLQENCKLISIIMKEKMCRHDHHQHTESFCHCCWLYWKL